MITKLRPGEIFVAGTNIQGAHGAGAAAQAHRDFGLEWGIGEGLSGQTYALPTMEGKKSFQKAIHEFLHFASNHQELTFLLTKVGQGIAGYTQKEVEDMFRIPDGLPENVIKVDWNN